MRGGSLAVALESEHRQIDEAIAGYIASPAHDRDPELVARAATRCAGTSFSKRSSFFRGCGGRAWPPPCWSCCAITHRFGAGLDEIDQELGAGVDNRVVAKHCHELGVRLQHHNSTEERIIYAEADQELDGPETAELTALLEASEPPVGWVCTKARPAKARPAEAPA